MNNHNDNQPRITIITPSFNQAQYLERSICSVIDQGYENLEYFVIDGGSTDGSQTIIDFYKDDITWSASYQNLNAAQAINKAYEKATGDIIAILSSDDIYLPGTLQDIAHKFTKNPDIAWLTGNIRRIDNHDNNLGKFTATMPDDFAAFLIQDTSYTSGAATFFRTSLLKKRQQLLDSSLNYAHEFDLACYCIDQGHLPYIFKKTLTAKREHPLSKSSTYTLKRGEEFVTVCERYIDDLPISDRYNVWHNCQQRRKIFDLANLESQTSQTRSFLWKQLLQRPSWLASDNYRQSLLNDITQSAPLRNAA
ncbi:UDP-Glc:alpha-D-GlcNAc-diphosphoundecaprenol beta-1,3-glucosyltransferase WfgD [Poriferisphaera corsica]|uniref:UDP-Glc:alpha-D-GlcNAc-diphosphoundecaprenol beta-1,3-glucosyltransferase WfgD n=1 Tax=Poriferisphaera corsica TaxID=2528020 RepID=A0A517YW46_9BACT|nr:glycosyltransferase [Poriferisphaera corsica]QDU34458.1 UDP-Glc:alpha-D-GlcNAc-diphosphoundecaprenol beta-1,3-glucosyltransferase WfgD [Poriferisphaera corsica]